MVVQCVHGDFFNSCNSRVMFCRAAPKQRCTEMPGASPCQWSSSANCICSTRYHTLLFSPGLNLSDGVLVLLRNHHACSIVCICKELGYEKESIMSCYSAYTVLLHYRKLLYNLQNPWKQSLFHSIPHWGAELFREQIFLSCDVGVC